MRKHLTLVHIIIRTQRSFEISIMSTWQICFYSFFLWILLLRLFNRRHVNKMNSRVITRKIKIPHFLITKRSWQITSQLWPHWNSNILLICYVLFRISEFHRTQYTQRYILTHLHVLPRKFPLYYWNKCPQWRKNEEKKNTVLHLKRVLAFLW